MIEGREIYDWAVKLLWSEIVLNSISLLLICLEVVYGMPMKYRNRSIRNYVQLHLIVYEQWTSYSLIFS